MSRGLFITIEGPDGSGKSTQLEFLKKFMADNNIDAVFTREPGGTEISEKIRSIILDTANKELEPMTETLLYAASRAQLTRQLIKPALMRGKTVVCDRFVDSSLAYQQYARGIGEAVSVVNEYAIDDCIPDITFLLMVSPEIAMKRLTGGMDRIESEGLEFQKAVYEGYKAIEEKYPERIYSVDASLTPAEISSIMESKLKELFGV